MLVLGIDAPDQVRDPVIGQARDQFDAAIGDLFDDQPGSLLRLRCDFNSPRQFHQSKGSTRLP